MYIDQLKYNISDIYYNDDCISAWQVYIQYINPPTSKECGHIIIYIYIYVFFRLILMRSILRHVWAYLKKLSLTELLMER